MTDNTRIHRSSAHLSHLIDLFLFKGAPRNHDPDRECLVLINHGYVVGYSPDRLQPLWSAYRVANATALVDYDRPHLYYADERVDAAVRLDNGTFGSHDDVAYDVGHMVPNEVINQQFGRLAQMETFFMTNMCPQRKTLNRGLWLKLENAIRDIEDMPEQRDHVWAIVGPWFDENPNKITRADGTLVDIPAGFFCVTIDPFRYRWDDPGNQHIACLAIPQDAPSGTGWGQYLVGLEVIEARARLELMPGWEAEIARERVMRPRGSARTAAPEASGDHRLIAALERQ